MQLELKDHDKETTVEVGEEVWVKPADARCRLQRSGRRG